MTMSEAARTVEISENELATLRQAKGLLDGLWNNPANGTKFKRLLKETNPKLSIPEIDIVDEAKRPIDEKLSAFEEGFKKIHERLDAKEKTDKEQKEERDLRKELDDVRGKFNLTDEGFNKVIQRMKDKKSYDPEAAAAWVVAQEPKVTPAGESKLGLPGKINLYGSAKEDKDWADLNKDPMSFFDSTVEDVFNNPQKFKEFGGDL